MQGFKTVTTTATYISLTDPTVGAAKVCVIVDILVKLFGLEKRRGNTQDDTRRVNIENGLFAVIA